MGRWGSKKVMKSSKQEPLMVSSPSEANNNYNDGTTTNNNTPTSPISSQTSEGTPEMNASLSPSSRPSTTTTKASGIAGAAQQGLGRNALKPPRPRMTNTSPVTNKTKSSSSKREKSPVIDRVSISVSEGTLNTNTNESNTAQAQQTISSDKAAEATPEKKEQQASQQIYTPPPPLDDRTVDSTVYGGGRYSVVNGESPDMEASISPSTKFRPRHMKKNRSFLRGDAASRVSTNTNKKKDKDDKYVLMEDGDTVTAGPSLDGDGTREGDEYISSRGKRSSYGEVDDFTLSTFGTQSLAFAERSAKRIFGRHHDAYSVEGLSYAGDNDLLEVKQKYAYCSILLSVIQLFVMVVMVSMCGVAPLDVNPMIGPYPDSLSYWGGKNGYQIAVKVEIWRLFTPVLLHAGFIHLLCNIAIQLETGAFFEREWGSGLWFVIYIVSAIGSSILSCISQPDTISVGATGALVGLFGAKLAEMLVVSAFETTRNRGDPSAHRFRVEQLTGALCSVSILSLFIFVPFVDWAGHMGGLGSGFFLGLMVFSCNVKNWCGRVFVWLIGFSAFVTGFLYSGYYLYMEMDFDLGLRDACEYFRQIYREGYDCTCQYTFDFSYVYADEFGDDDDGTWG